VPIDTHFFRGKVAVVTGAASGIGRALATALAQRGAVVVLADIDEAGAKAAADALGALSAAVSGVGLDVTDAGAFAELVEHTIAEHGCIDLLFNNAGVGMGGEVADMNLVHWNRVIDVNLRGVVHGLVAVYPHMIHRGRGHIVNTASLAGLLPAPMLTPYSMTKHGVVGLSTSLRAEAAGHGVHVSVVCPGVIDTPLLDKGNPVDVPEVASLPDGRRMLTRSIGSAYPAASLAVDVLTGVARNRAFIVSPRHARTAWALYRLAPSAVVRSSPFILRRALRQSRR
jgi:NAD(P)-dependent dehydrogenase (short-subunit alcohol dehydrogenase family)